MKIKSKLWLIALVAFIALVMTACPDSGGSRPSGRGTPGGGSNPDGGDSEPTPGLQFNSIDGGTAYEVSLGTATATNIMIPAEHNGRPVTRIAEVISDGSSYVGGFAGSSITSVTIPASVTTIARGAFYKCESLTTITFAAGSQLTTIGAFAFNECTSLTNITIPASVTSIGDWAFSGCTNLETVTFAAGSQLTTIGTCAFSNCNSLTSITIPASVATMGASVFQHWTSGQTIRVHPPIPPGWDSNWQDNSSATVIDNNTGLPYP